MCCSPAGRSSPPAAACCSSTPRAKWAGYPTPRTGPATPSPECRTPPSTTCNRTRSDDWEHTNSSYRTAIRDSRVTHRVELPLARVTELKLAGDPFDWLPDRWDPPEVEPSVELWAGDRSVVLPLPWAGRTKWQRPDITAVLDRLHNRWGQESDRKRSPFRIGKRSSKTATMIQSPTRKLSPLCATARCASAACAEWRSRTSRPRR